MASSGIKISAELRPCEVDGKRALFHGWGAGVTLVKRSDDYFNSHDTTGAIVEYEDGQVAEVEPGKVRFLDNPHIGFYWPEDAGTPGLMPEPGREPEQHGHFPITPVIGPGFYGHQHLRG